MAIAGSELTVQLDEEGHATGAPSLPRSYDMAEMEVLPVGYLDRPITVAEPLTEEELAALIASLDPDGDGVTASETEFSDIGNPPYSICNPALDCEPAPGHGGTPPGQSDKLPPGQEEVNPGGQSKPPKDK
jgi:hypothetical protein